MAETTTTKQYLIFTLAEERYALGIGAVQEVLASAPLQRVPDKSGQMRGLINLRGSPVPVIDLAQRLGIGTTGEAAGASIIVLERTDGAARRLLGAYADSVQAVVELDESSIEPASRLAGAIATKLVTGIAKHEGSFFIVLDGPGLFDGESAAPLDSGRPAKRGD